MTEEYTVGRTFKRSKKGDEGWNVSSSIVGIETEDEAEEMMLKMKELCLKLTGQTLLETPQEVQ